MSDQITCCFPVEVKARELDSRLYTSLKCVREGFISLLGSKNGIEKYMCTMQNRFIYVGKSIMPFSFYEKIKSYNGIFICLDEEGGVYINWSFFNYRMPENHILLMDKIFIWGTRQKEMMLQNTKNINIDKIIITGNPRFDLCKPKFYKYHHELRKQNSLNNQDYILVDTSFVSANNQIGWEEYYKNAKSEMKDKFDADLQKNIYYYQKLLMHYFIHAIRDITQTFPNLKVVVRPHPSEDINFYKNELKDEKKVLVRREGSALEWIIDSLLVIHHDCTTGIEAFFAEKPVISYAPILDSEFVQKLPMQISEIIYSKDKLIERIKDILNSNGHQNNIKNKSNKTDTIKQLITNIDFDSSELIVEELKKCSKKVNTFTTNNQNNIKKINSNYLQRLNKTIRKVILYPTNQTMKNINYTLQRKNKFPGLKIEELKKRIHLFREIDSSIPEINVQSISKDTHLLSRK